MLKKLVFIVVALLVLRSAANSAVYQWTDEKGGLHFSDQPPLSAEKVAPAKTAAKAPRPRAFPLPQHGNLVLSVPEDWDHEIRQPPDNLPPTIVLTPREGDDFEILITPLWSYKNEPGFNNPQMIKRLISDALARMLPTAVEREVPLVEIQGTSGVGYYFFVTDKAPGQGYPYGAQAGIGVGDLLLTVTVLCRTKDSEGLRQTLQALRGAAHIKG